MNAVETTTLVVIAGLAIRFLPPLSGAGKSADAPLPPEREARGLRLELSYLDEELWSIKRRALIGRLTFDALRRRRDLERRRPEITARLRELDALIAATGAAPVAPPAAKAQGGGC